jgi:cytochrome c oxidase subunit 1
MPLAGEMFFMLSTMLIAVPTGREGVQLDRDDVEGIADVRATDAVSRSRSCSCSRSAAFSGLMMAIAPVDFQYHDTVLHRAHFHTCSCRAQCLRSLAAVYYWLPKWTGHMY